MIGDYRSLADGILLNPEMEGAVERAIITHGYTHGEITPEGRNRCGSIFGYQNDVGVIVSLAFMGHCTVLFKECIRICMLSKERKLPAFIPPQTTQPLHDLWAGYVALDPPFEFPVTWSVVYSYIIDRGHRVLNVTKNEITGWSLDPDRLITLEDYTNIAKEIFSEKNNLIPSQNTVLASSVSRMQGVCREYLKGTSRRIQEVNRGGFTDCRMIVFDEEVNSSRYPSKGRLFVRSRSSPASPKARNKKDTKQLPKVMSSTTRKIHRRTRSMPSDRTVKGRNMPTLNTPSDKPIHGLSAPKKQLPRQTKPLKPAGTTSPKIAPHPTKKKVKKASPASEPSKSPKLTISAPAPGSDVREEAEKLLLLSPIRSNIPEELLIKSPREEDPVSRVLSLSPIQESPLPEALVEDQTKKEPTSPLRLTQSPPDDVLHELMEPTEKASTPLLQSPDEPTGFTSKIVSVLDDDDDDIQNSFYSEAHRPVHFVPEPRSPTTIDTIYNQYIVSRGKKIQFNVFPPQSEEVTDQGRRTPLKGCIKRKVSTECVEQPQQQKESVADSNDGRSCVASPVPMLERKRKPRVSSPSSPMFPQPFTSVSPSSIATESVSVTPPGSPTQTSPLLSPTTASTRSVSPARKHKPVTLPASMLRNKEVGVSIHSIHNAPALPEPPTQKADDPSNVVESRVTCVQVDMSDDGGGGRDDVDRTANSNNGKERNLQLVDLPSPVFESGKTDTSQVVIAHSPMKSRRQPDFGETQTQVHPQAVISPRPRDNNNGGEGRVCVEDVATDPQPQAVIMMSPRGVPPQKLSFDSPPAPADAKKVPGAAELPTTPTTPSVAASACSDFPGKGRMFPTAADRDTPPNYPTRGLSPIEHVIHSNAESEVLDGPRQQVSNLVNFWETAERSNPPESKSSKAKKEQQQQRPPPPPPPPPQPTAATTTPKQPSDYSDEEPERKRYASMSPLAVSPWGPGRRPGSAPLSPSLVYHQRANSNSQLHEPSSPEESTIQSSDIVDDDKQILKEHLALAEDISPNKSLPDISDIPDGRLSLSPRSSSRHERNPVTGPLQLATVPPPKKRNNNKVIVKKAPGSESRKPTKAEATPTRKATRSPGRKMNRQTGATTATTTTAATGDEKLGEYKILKKADDGVGWLAMHAEDGDFAILEILPYTPETETLLERSIAVTRYLSTKSPSAHHCDFREAFAAQSGSGDLLLVGVRALSGAHPEPVKLKRIIDLSRDVFISLVIQLELWYSMGVVYHGGICKTTIRYRVPSVDTRRMLFSCRYPGRPCGHIKGGTDDYREVLLGGVHSVNLSRYVEQSLPARPQSRPTACTPPELLLHYTDGCQQSDSWSLACLLYELVVGRPLFDCELTVAALVTRIASIIGPPPPGYPPVAVFSVDGSCFDPLKQHPNLSSLIVRTLQWDPDLRPTPVEMLRHQWVAPYLGAHRALTNAFR